MWRRLGGTDPTNKSGLARQHGTTRAGMPHCMPAMVCGLRWLSTSPGRNRQNLGKEEVLATEGWRSNGRYTVVQATVGTWARFLSLVGEPRYAEMTGRRSSQQRRRVLSLTLVRHLTPDGRSDKTCLTPHVIAIITSTRSMEGPRAYRLVEVGDGHKGGDT